MKDRAMIFLFMGYALMRGLLLDGEEGALLIVRKTINEAKAALHHGLEGRSM